MIKVGWGEGGGHLLVQFCGRHKWVTSKAIIKKSKCLESKRVRYSRNFNYKTYRNLIISSLIVITVAIFSVYLLQLITNSYSLIHQKFVILRQVNAGWDLSENFQKPESRKNLEKSHAWPFKLPSRTDKFFNGDHWIVLELKQFVTQTTKTQ